MSIEEKLIGKPDASVYLSPEGMEEKIVHMQRYFITLTQGGKYRVYTDTDGKEVHTLRITDMIEDARKEVAMVMGMHASLILDPKATIQALLGMLKK